MNVSHIILAMLASALFAGGCDPVVPAEDFEPAAVEGFAPRAAPDEGTLYGRLQNSDKDVRIEAVLEATRRRDRAALPYLVDRLGDDYVEVRFAAIVALEKMTGSCRGYRYWAPLADRAEAVARWRQWLRNGSSNWPGRKRS